MFQRQNLRRLILLLISLLLLPSISWSLSTDRNQPMKISSVSSSIDRNKGIAIFTGNVIFDQGSTHVTGDKMTIYFDKKNQVQQAVVEGNLAQVTTKTDPAKPDLHAKALTIKYFPNQHEIQLLGQAYTEQQGNVMQGQQLYYNTQTQVLITPNVNGNRTTIILQPKTQQPAKKSNASDSDDYSNDN